MNIKIVTGGHNMCGFVGFIGNNNPKEKKQIIKKMSDLIAHRGPDGEGYFTNEFIAMGHRRLSIVDLKGGTQPMYNEDKKIAIVFNGEIYNFQELKNELQKNHNFLTNCDTEVLIHGYEEWGIKKLLQKLIGMFAFVIYDANNNKVVGARDHFGIKPFYYYKKDNNFFFGSEIKSFLAHPNFEKKVNKKALKMFLIFQYSVHEETFFENVYKLKPGHYFEYEKEKLKIQRYFDVTYERKNKNKENIEKELEKTLEQSIKYHLATSDVEVGSYLSGGVDSSYVVSVARPDKTFSVGFDIDGFDESMYAKELSELLKIKNYSKHISADEFFKALPLVEYYTDEPEANLSAVPLYYLSKLASEHVKVVLSGEGSDEMFAGYNEYYEPLSLRIYAKIPLIIRQMIRNIVKIFPHFPGQNTLIKYGLPFDERYIGHGTLMEEWEANEILCDNLKNNETIHDVLKPIYDRIKKQNLLTQKMYIDMHFWLPQDILLKADKMTMANSLELRVPLLDLNVFNCAKKVPLKFLIHGKQTKYLFRKIAHKKIPVEWAQRRKLGFPVPFSKWIQEEKYYYEVKNLFTSEFVKEFFDVNVINRLLEEHYSGKKNNGRKIYNIYTFLIWYQVYFLKDKLA